MNNTIIKVEVKCSGYGTQYWETVELTKEDIEELAVAKLQERDYSPSMDPVNVEICLNAN